MHAYSHYSSLSVSGKYLVSNLNDFLKSLATYGCNILKSKMSVMGNEMLFSTLIGGDWGAIAKLEAAIPKLELKLQLSINCQRTELLPAPSPHQTYNLEASALDKVGLLHKLLNFLKTQKIKINDILTYSYESQNKTQMLHMSLKIDIPATTQIIRFRDELSEISEILNLDSYLELAKN